jgi:hypothetical protein
MTLQTSAAPSERLTGLGYGFDRFIIDLIDPTFLASLAGLLEYRFNTRSPSREGTRPLVGFEQEDGDRAIVLVSQLREVMSFLSLGGSNLFASTFE